MNSRLQEIQQEYEEFLKSMPLKTDSLDHSKAEKHINVLKSFDVVEGSSISIFDFNLKEHVYQSENFGKVLGYTARQIEELGDAFISRKVHPDDHLRLIENGINLLHYFYDLPVENRMDYKLINDFRLENGEGSYVRVIEQHQALELDPEGNIWLALSVLDISPDQNIDKPIKSRLLNFKTGRNDYLNKIPNKYKDADNESKLSKRELQILKLIKQGNFSKEIADKLYISIHTVNTHRQNILQKLNVGNSVEAVQYADQYGLFALIDEQ